MYNKMSHEEGRPVSWEADGVSHQAPLDITDALEADDARLLRILAAHEDVDPGDLVVWLLGRHAQVVGLGELVNTGEPISNPARR